ncbi:MAG: hypothetical protein LBQ35_07295 [Spirochaetaceae bacterium]|jgi:hypothetical protein|nr:hypothetical protein [Spirochaetaceae bacterium]
MKKDRAAFLLVFLFMLGSCYTEPEIISDSYTPQVNPLTGTWRAEDGGYWVFKGDGTGGRAEDETAEPEDTFSYLYWQGRGAGVKPSQGLNTLVTAGGDSSDAAAATVKQYIFTQNSNGTVTLTPQNLELQGNDYYRVTPDTAAAFTLTRVSGGAGALSLNNPLIGEWHADWNGSEHDGSVPTWSYKFRTDGTVRTYHHGLHQFDNGYLVRNKVLVLLGEWRFDNSLGYTSSTITLGADGNFTAKEFHHGALEWVFRRVDAAVWK